MKTAKMIKKMKIKAKIIPLKNTMNRASKYKKIAIAKKTIMRKIMLKKVILKKKKSKIHTRSIIKLKNLKIKQTTANE